MTVCIKTDDLAPRLARELKTVKKMIRIFCRKNHQSGKILCDSCRALEEYAAKRLSRCSFGEQKPTCGKCPIHCYRKDMKTRIQDVMRFSGPRMMLYHPILAIAHLLDGRKYWQDEDTIKTVRKRENKT